MKSFSHTLRGSAFVLLYTAIFSAFAVLSYFAAYKDIFPHPAPASKTYRFETDFAYVDLPRLSASLSSSSDTVHVQIDVTLEIAKKNASTLNIYKPRLTEKLNMFFSGLHPNQVLSSRSVPWLREELLKQVNNADLPVPIHAVWVQRFIVTEPPTAISHLVISPTTPTS